VSLLGDVPLIGCIFNFGTALGSIIQDCSDPHKSCLASTLFNGIFAGAGCVTGPFGTLAGLLQCSINIADALSSLGICQEDHPAAFPARAGLVGQSIALTRQNNAN